MFRSDLWDITPVMKHIGTKTKAMIAATLSRVWMPKEEPNLPPITQIAGIFRR